MTPPLLQGKVAVVTGAQRGIGRAIAQALGDHGASLVVNDLVAHGIDVVAQELRATGCDARPIEADIGTRSGAVRLIDAAVGAFGRIDVLVNNAGVLVRQPLLEIDESAWDEQFRVNVRGPLLCTQAAARQMKTIGVGGRIINITSVAARIPRLDLAAYCASKAALAQLTKVMALELARDGITVNSVAPGPTQTEMAVGSFLGGSTSVLEQIVAGSLADFRLGIPMGRLTRPDEVASAVLFFASPLADAVTGQVLYVDGGLEML